MKALTLSFVVVSTLFVFTNCQKAYEEQIIGSWKHGNIADEFENTVWQFNSDGSLYIISDPNCGNNDTCFATYSIEGQFYIPYVIVEDVDPNLDGKYQADELSDEFLKMTRIEMGDGSTSQAYLRREFLRQ